MRKVILIITVLIFTSHSNSQWFQQNSGGFMTNFHNVQMLSSNTVFVAGFYPDLYGWVYRTTNAGVNWSVSYQTPAPLKQINSVSFSSANTGTACGGIFFIVGSLVIRTTNGGANWVTQSTGTNFYHNDVQMTDDNTVYLVGQSGTIFKTTNGGVNWNQQTSGTTRRFQGVSFINSNIGVAVGDTGTIVKTTNGGVNWVVQTSGTTASFYNVAMLNTNNAMVVGSGGTILKTTDGGSNWVQLSSGVTQTLRGISYINANHCYVTGDGSVIRRTTNGGADWSPQNSTLTQSVWGVSFIDTSTGTAVGDNAKIIRTTNGGITFIQPVSGEVPNEFSLEQNYPNPFNPTTHFEFRIAESGLVNLKIFDVLGREVATLINEELTPGTYRTDWDASNYPSGVYYYKMSIVNSESTIKFQETKKMVLIK